MRVCFAVWELRPKSRGGASFGKFGKFGVVNHQTEG